jgi:hypothetical protein
MAEVDTSFYKDNVVQNPLDMAGKVVDYQNKLLHKTRERVHRAWRTITDGQATLAKNRRLHVINGAPAEFSEPIEIPKWPNNLSTVENYDAANVEASILATEFETRAHKISSYLSTWERSTMDEQSRALILALADRLDRMETK